MIFGFYHRFYRATNNLGISILLAYLVRLFSFLFFLVKMILTKRKTVDLSHEEALARLERVSADPGSNLSYERVPVDESVDLSIVVPIYNHIHEVHACIESLLKQETEYRYELILVDDGSTDGIQDELDQYTLIPYVTVIHQENQGIAGARNTGVSHASGKYLMFVDCDDLVHSNIVQVLMQQAYLGDNDIVMGAHELVKKKDGEIQDVIPFILPQANLCGYRNGDTIMNYDGLPWGKVYRRELFDQVRFFSGYWYEDTIVHMLLFMECKRFAYIPQVIYDYIFYESNFTHVQFNPQKPRPKSIDRYWLLRAITQRYEELKLPTNAVFYTALLKHVSAYYYNTIANLPEDVVEAMFVAGRELLLKYRPEGKVKLPPTLRITEKAMIKKDISHWKLCSLNQ